MLRVFLVLLAVLLAVLAFVFGRPWLYAGAGVPLLWALGLFGWRAWTQYESHQRRDSVRPSDPEAEDDLEEFGIMDVRPKEGEGASAGASSDSGEGAGTGRESPTAAPAPAQSERDPRTSIPSSNPASDHPAVAPPDPTDEEASASEPDAPSTQQTPEASPAAPSEDASALSALLESARVALNAHTVCLLVQEDVALEYRIESCASRASDVQTSGVFEAQVPLLSARRARQPVTVQALDDPTRAALGYYRTRPDGLTQMAVAPIQRPDDPSTTFLLADATEAADLATRRARRLLKHYARTVDLLWDHEVAAPSATDDATTESSLTASLEDAPEAEGRDEDAPPPRRAIIEEEMEAARAASDALSLALVHLNRAEAIARRGPDTVETTERRMRARLKQEAPGQRIERFGELTYGIFLRKGADAVEDWAVDVQEALSGETGALEGGVSVGIAVRGPSHDDPERLRADAIEALREAYETGTCTIVT